MVDSYFAILHRRRLAFRSHNLEYIEVGGVLRQRNHLALEIQGSPYPLHWGDVWRSNQAVELLNCSFIFDWSACASHGS